MANQFLGLSLFIMLLSFFLILNSLSSFDETKSKPVLNSLSIAFSKQDVEENPQPSIEADPADSYREGSTLDKLETLFRAEISAADIQKNRLGTVMHIRVGVERFEKSMLALSSVQAINSNEFGPMLVSLLQAEGAIPYRMDMILNMKDNPASVQNEAPQEILDKTLKVSGFAQSLERAGLPKNLVTAGIGRGPEETVDIYFRRYQPFDPRGKRAVE